MMDVLVQRGISLVVYYVIARPTHCGSRQNAYGFAILVKDARGGIARCFSAVVWCMTIKMIKWSLMEIWDHFYLLVIDMMIS